jgi:hypothetical protein
MSKVLRRSTSLLMRLAHVRSDRRTSDLIVFVYPLISLIVVLIYGLLEEALVSRGTVGSTWRSGHVIGVSLGFSLSSLDCHFGPLVETPEG